jgi:uncharacterized membrane protein
MKAKKHFIFALGKFLLPLVILVIIVISLWIARAELALGLLIAYGFSLGMFIGRFVMVPFVVKLDLNLTLAITILVVVDAFWGAMITYNFDLLSKIPRIGKLIFRIEQKGRKILEKYRWAKRLGMLGIVIFVALPFYGTNAVIGGVVGRLMGMKELHTWLPIVLGAIIGAFIIAIISIPFKIVF